MENNRSTQRQPPKKADNTTPRWHGPVVWILIILGSLLLPIMLMAFWVKNTLLNTDNYLGVVGPLSYNPTVATAMTNYATTQLFQTDQIANAIKNALPANAQFLVLPLTNSLLEFTQTKIYGIVTSQDFNRLWVEANRVVQQQIVSLLLGKGQALTLQNGQVILDVGQAIDAVKTSLGREGLGIVEQYAPNLTNRQIVLFQAPRLASWQPYVVLIEQSTIALPFVILLLFGAALWLSLLKRAALLKIGLGVGLAMILLSLLIMYGRTYYINQPFRLPFTPQVAAVLYDSLTQPLWYTTELVFGLGLLTALIVLLSPQKRT